MPPGFALPEFTRALRGLAAPGALGRPEHAGVFGPLIAARKLAEHAGGIRARVAAFDPARLKRGWIESIDGIASARVPKAGADRRALTARLAEHARDVFAALDTLERAAAKLRLAGDIPDAASWHGWIVAVQALFDSADKFWFAIEPELGPRPRAKKIKAPKGASAARAVAGILLGATALAATAQAQHVTVRVPGVAVDSLRARIRCGWAGSRHADRRRRSGAARENGSARLAWHRDPGRADPNAHAPERADDRRDAGVPRLR